MQELYSLASCFRNAIDIAFENNEFFDDVRFRHFPMGCCDDACDLLGKYLDEHGYNTQQIVGTYRDGEFEDITSHAWLIYDKSTIIDITGDQFKSNALFLNFNTPVYVGQSSEFYKLFDIDRIYENCDVGVNERLKCLYKIIAKYL